MNALDEITTLIRQYDQGLWDRHDIVMRIDTALSAAAGRLDESTGEAAAAAIRSASMAPEDAARFASTAFACLRGTWESPDPRDPRMLSAVEALRDRATAFLAGASPDDAVAFVGALPPPWTDDDWLDLALRSVAECADPARAARTLTGSVGWRRGRRALAELLLDPFLAEPSRGSVGLAAHALVSDAVETRRRGQLEEHVLTHAAGDEDDLDLLVARWSTDARDPEVLELGRRMVAGGADLDRSGPIVALALWIGGDRAAAAELAGRFTRRDWWSSARMSLCEFILARESGAPETPHALVRRDQEYLAGIPTVGALVGRLAHLQWRACVELGDERQAIRSAAAVVRYHGFRGYELHLQGYGMEFDPRLVDRLAVTPDEVLEARAFLDQRGVDPEEVKLFFSEGSVYYGHGEEGWRS